MGAKRHLVCALILAGLFACLPREALPAPREDSEKDLLARLARETNPVQKAKYEARLARVKLLQAMEACQQGDIEGSQRLLGAYLERVKSAWDTLQKTGRQAHRKPQGFKELDIELREDTRYLEDLKRRFPFTNREPAEKAAEEVEKLRAEVLAALFPPVEPKK
jgi:cellulose biosynthesis protein BcsQ